MTPSTTFADDAERYRLDSRIATGGMGEVWRSTDTRLGRTVAVKLLKNEYADDATFRSRFTSEAHHAAALHHPGVAAVYDYGEADDSGSPRPYLVMELVDGQPLSALITPGRPMDPDVTRDLMAQAADAIGAAHIAGIVHRDVKPANLLVTPDRRIKITDFGIARAAEGMALTQTGQVMGTPQYLSPEQAQGGAATPASDVYSLGVVAFECLTSRRPFVGETPVATALAHLREPVPELPGDIPRDLAAVVRRAMAKEPADRFPDGTALAAAFREPATVALAPAAALAAAAPATAVLGGVTPVPPPSDPDQQGTGRRGIPWLWVLLAVVVLGAIIAFAAFGGDDPEPAADQEPGRSPDTSQPTTEAPAESTPPPESAPAPPPESPTEDDTFDITEADYLGRDINDVEQELEDLGLDVSEEKLDNDGTHEEETVESVTPTSGLREGVTVVVEYWDKASSGPPPDAPGGDEGQEGDQQ